MKLISDVNRISICSIIFLCCRPSLVYISLLSPTPLPFPLSPPHNGPRFLVMANRDDRPPSSI